MDLVVVDLVMC